MRGADYKHLKMLVTGAALAACFAPLRLCPIAEVANAEVTIVRPLSFVIDDNLDFGNVIRCATAGTVTMAPDGVRTRTGGVILANGGGHKPASFAGRGSYNQRVDISLGANSIFLTGPGANARS